jgi:hypothetical protein
VLILHNKEQILLSDLTNISKPSGQIYGCYKYAVPSTSVWCLFSWAALCNWLDRSEIYTTVIYILDLVLRLKVHRK